MQRERGFAAARNMDADPVEAAPAALTGDLRDVGVPVAEAQQRAALVAASASERHDVATSDGGLAALTVVLAALRRCEAGVHAWAGTDAMTRVQAWTDADAGRGMTAEADPSTRVDGGAK